MEEFRELVIGRNGASLLFLVSGSPYKRIGEMRCSLFVLDLVYLPLQVVTAIFLWKFTFSIFYYIFIVFCFIQDYRSLSRVV